jgi:transketolase
MDGHDVRAVIDKLQAVLKVKAQPSIIIAHTVKGKGVSFVEADFTFHGLALSPEQAEKAREEILNATW